MGENIKAVITNGTLIPISFVIIIIGAVISGYSMYKDMETENKLLQVQVTNTEIKLKEHTNTNSDKFKKLENEMNVLSSVLVNLQYVNSRLEKIEKKLEKK